MSWDPEVAVLIPCLNEEAAIGKVVADFRDALPDALIFVYDNGSTDRTIEVAKNAGAIVRNEPLKGMGNVMRRMFADVEADVYVLVDGMIRANEAVFDAKPHAPQQLIDAVGIIEDDLFRVQNWRGLLNKNRLLLEDAVGFKAGKDVL